MAAAGWGELEPGVVYSAPQLARRYSANVAQVGGSLVALMHDGLFVPVLGGGYRLTAPTPDELRELIELRLLIEVPSARTAAEAGTSDDDLDRVGSLAEATMTAARAGNLLGYIRADLEFHLKLVGLVGNGQLVEVVRLLRARSRIPTIRPFAAAFMLENAREHRDMTRMLGEGDGSGIDDLLRRHIGRVLD